MKLKKLRNKSITVTFIKVIDTLMPGGNKRLYLRT